MNNDNPLIPLSAIRAIAVEAIREVTGCPDISNHGKHLSDVMEQIAKAAALLRASEGRVPEGWTVHTDAHNGGEYWLRDSQAKLIARGMPESTALRLRALLTAAPNPPAQQAEPLFLLHTGEIDSSGEQAEWEIEHDSQQRVDAFCALNPGVTVKLFAGAPPHKAEGAEQ